MGRAYKLSTEIKDFILAQKKADPHLSCRALSILIKDKFNKGISKSRVNTLLKAQGLSRNVGRPRSSVKQDQAGLGYEIDCAAALFLKGVDEQLSTSFIIKQFSRNAFPKSNSSLLEYKNNLALYSPIFHPQGLDKLGSYSGTGLWHIACGGKKIHKSSVSKYLEIIGQLDIASNIKRGIELGTELVNFIAIHPAKGETFYVDAGCHLLWFKPKGVSAYNLPIIPAQQLVKDVFSNNKPLLLLSSMSYQPLPPELAVFFSAINIEDNNKINAVSLLNSKAEEVYRVDNIRRRKINFVFAVLPWQIGELLFPAKASEAKKVKIGAFNTEFIIESREVSFPQLVGNKYVRIRIVLLKSVSSQPRLCLVTNISNYEKNDIEVADLYLKRWPNAEEGFEDMLKRVELVKCPQLAKTHNSIDINKLGIDVSEGNLTFRGLLTHLLEYLNKMCQLRFFPQEYQSFLSLDQMRERFFRLSGKIIQTGQILKVSIYYPSDFSYLDDLKYACHRFNEEDIQIRHKRVFLIPEPIQS